MSDIYDHIGEYCTIYGYDLKKKKRTMKMNIFKVYLPMLGIDCSESVPTTVEMTTDAFRMFEKKVEMLEKLFPGEEVRI